ncbi:MAG: hypothetical protein CEN90_190 [Parcubacteria group bacterium Licking1014_17]|nr:MAG: hypothetical protein CEN90_190 [Parcubacteria group bacterium Licking1014_17]
MKLLELRNNRYFLGALLLLGFIGLSFLLYGNSIKGDWVHDDIFFSARGELRSVDYLPKIWLEPYLPDNISAGAYRPFTIFTIALNFILFGESPISFHITSILLNGIAAFLVFLAVYRLFRKKILAAFTAAFFSLLPIHTQAVDLIKAREEILAAIFILLSWLVFIRATKGEKFSPWLIFLSSFLCFLGFLSKEYAVMAPFVILIVYKIKENPAWQKFISAGLLFLPAYMVYFLLRHAVLGGYAFGNDPVNFALNPLAHANAITAFFTAFKILFIYVGKTFVPVNLSATYGYNHLTLVTNLFQSPEAVFGILIAAAFLFLIFNKKFRSSPVGVGAMIFLVSYFIFSKFVFKNGGEIMAEHWMYTPSIGLGLVAGEGFDWLYRRKKIIGIAVFCAVIAVYSLILIKRNEVWLSKKSLAQSMLKGAPDSFMGYIDMAEVLLREGDIPKAREIAEKGMSIDDKYVPLISVMGDIAFAEKKYSEAENYYKEALEKGPTTPVNYSSFGKFYYNTGQYGKAADIFRPYIYNAAHPGLDEVGMFLTSLVKVKQYQESIDVIEKFFGRSTKDPRIRFLLAASYYKRGEISEAQKYFDWSNSLSSKEKLKLINEF